MDRAIRGFGSAKVSCHGCVLASFGFIEIYGLGFQGSHGVGFGGHRVNQGVVACGQHVVNVFDLTIWRRLGFYVTLVYSNFFGCVVINSCVAILLMGGTTALSKKLLLVARGTISKYNNSCASSAQNCLFNGYLGGEGNLFISVCVGNVILRVGVVNFIDVVSTPGCYNYGYYTRGACGPHGCYNGGRHWGTGTHL